MIRLEDSWLLLSSQTLSKKKTGQISLYSLQELSVTKSPLKPSKDVLLGGNVHSFKMIFKPLKPPKITLNKINK